MSVFAMLAGEANGLTFTIPVDWLYGIGGAAAVGVMGIAFKWLRPKLVNHFKAVHRLRKAEQALDPHSPGLWIAPSFTPSPIADYKKKIKNSVPIIVVANLKGGVGKTTTVANLIGHYGLKKAKRILAIDLDFQGSLTTCILSEADYKRNLEEQAYGSHSKAAQLVGGKDAQWVRDVSEAVFRVQSARCIPSYYTLSMMENRVLFEWLISKRADDIRYTLAAALHDPIIQESFDMILIDAPPRLTTGCVQALCAATHVLIPTVLDGLSAEGVGGFVDQLVTNERLWPHLRLLGVFGNMTDVATTDLDGEPRERALADYEQEAERTTIDAVRFALERAQPTLRSTQAAPMFPINTFIPNKSELGRRAGDRIGYLAHGGIDAVQAFSRAYDRLADEIDRRISAATVG